MDDPSGLSLYSEYIAVAFLWMRREVGRLADWSGFGVLLTAMLIGVLSAFVAICAIIVGSSSSGTTLVLAGMFGFLSGGAAAILISPIADAGSAEQSFALRVTRLDETRAAYAEAQRKHAVRMQREAQARRVAMESQRKAEEAEQLQQQIEDYDRQQVAVMRSTAAKLSRSWDAGIHRCWYCQLAVRPSSIQCPYCHQILIREIR